MLTSITPLGERGRGFRWGVTFASLLAGAMFGGAAAGALLGALGALVLPPGGEAEAPRLAALGGLLAIGLALDAGVGGLRLPTVRRQVDERWLNAYRGWVYGLGFGVQLGAGMATIVSVSAVYVTFAACFLAASAPLGLAIGGLFGVIRAGTVLAAARVDRPERLFELGRSLRRWEPRTRRMALLSEGLLSVAALAIAVGLA